VAIFFERLGYNTSVRSIQRPANLGIATKSTLKPIYERNWNDSREFKDDLIELLDASKFGKAYTLFEIFMKAPYEYFKDELEDEAPRATGPVERLRLVLRLNSHKI
jgi:hypothetical protein